MAPTIVRLPTGSISTEPSPIDLPCPSLCQKSSRGFSEKHSNFFENLGAARAVDVVALMREAQRRVREQFGIELQNEVELVGEGFE